MNCLNATSETLAVQGGAARSSTSPSSANLSSGRTGKAGSERGAVAASQFTSMGLLAGGDRRAVHGEQL